MQGDPAEQPAADNETRLAPPELGSPRQTLDSARTYTRRATDQLRQAFAISKATGQFLDTPEITSLKRLALVNLSRAAETLDLSNAPPAAKQNVGLTSALLLQEVRPNDGGRPHSVAAVIFAGVARAEGGKTRRW